MGSMCMAIIGSMSGLMLILTLGDEAANAPLAVAAAYLVGGLSAVALFLLASTLQDDV